jgi:hypothetical protein
MLQNKSHTTPSAEKVGVSTSRAFDGFCTAKVLSVGWKKVLLDRTPLSPSKPNCAGDQGTVDGILTVDVVEHDGGGFLHVLDKPLGLEPGDKVRVWRDPIRRDKLERAHTATLVCRAELSRMGTAVVSAEIVAGLAWIEIAGPVPNLNLKKAIQSDQEIEVLGRRAGQMAVFLEDRIIDTVDAPFATRTGSISGTEVSATSALGGGRAAIEVALPDKDGRPWWR